jgi:hypothetical protein
MLNTNQSQKKKSWKYALVLPFLVAFTLLFQIETVAQEKENKTKEVSSYSVSSIYSSILTKNTTDREIKELEKSFSDEKQKLKISNVIRNNNDEIIAIKLEFDFGKSYNRVMERKSDKGINSIKIYINSDKNDDLAYGFEDVNITPIEVTLLQESDEEPKLVSMSTLYRNGKEIVLIINGKEKITAEKIQVDLDDDLGDIKEISASEYEEKYNKKADKNKLYYEVNTIKKSTVIGYDKVIAKQSEEPVLFLYNMIVETSDSKKNSDKTKEKSFSGYSVSYETLGLERNSIRTKEKEKFGNNDYYETVVSYETSRPAENIERIKKNKSVDYKKALIIYDSKEISPTELETIDPNSIASVSSMIATEYALKKYGERAKNGVVIIESQAYFKKNNPNLKTDFETFDFKLDSDNNGFVIGKNSSKEDLSFYKTTLARSNVSFSFSGIKRNDKGEITAITINLSKDDVKIKRNFKSTNPIPSLFIGKKNGKIVIEESK